MVVPQHKLRTKQFRVDPTFKLAVGRKPLDEDNYLAIQPTFSRLENAATRKDIYRLTRAMVDQFIASYAGMDECDVYRHIYIR